MSTAAGNMLARRLRVVELYRRCLREIPRVQTVFDLDVSEKEIRGRVRALFRKHDDVTDPRVVDHLLLRGEIDLQETVEVWKQKTHLMRLLGFDETPKPVLKERQGESEFLQKFFSGQWA